MKKASAISVIATLAALALATPASAAEKPSSGVKLATMLIQLDHPGGLRKFVRQVSTPTSARYREYRSVNYLAKRYGAKPKQRAKALAWLARRGIDGEVGPTGSWITASVKPRAVPAAFLADGVERRRLMREGFEAPVPAALTGVVDSVAILGSDPDAFGPAALSAPPTPPASGRPNTGTPSGCADGVATNYERGFPAAYNSFTPNQYLTAYGHSKLQSQGLSGKGERVSLIEIDGYLPEDIRTFADCFGVRVPPIRQHLIGLDSVPPIQGETTLDLEVLAAAAPGLKRIDLYTNPGTEAGIFLSAAEAIAAKGKPDVISVSLEGCEAGIQGQVTFVRAFDNTMAVAAGAGISTLIASGDQGSTMCSVGPPIGSLPIPTASTPATSPWVTAVGGTNLVLDAQNRIADQVTWNDSPDAFAAGGSGLSILESRPWYQRGAISKRRADGMRTVPDIAGLADVLPGYAIYCSAPTCPGAADWTPIGGTSAATPLFAGGVALLNEQAAKSGHANVGFLNPLLYAEGTGKRPGRLFDDVTEGDTDLGTLIPPSAGGGQPVGCCSAGPGFDLATGFGSPYVDVLGKLAQGYAK